MAKRDEIKTMFGYMTVTANEQELYGNGIFNVEWLVGKECDVLATFIHRFTDNSMAPAFLVEDTDGTIRTAACVKCVVVNKK